MRTYLSCRADGGGREVRVLICGHVCVFIGVSVSRVWLALPWRGVQVTHTAFARQGTTWEEGGEGIDRIMSVQFSFI